MTTVLTLLGFSLGAFFCCVNFYLSFVRYPLFIRRGGKKEAYRWASGFPLVGSVLVIATLALGNLPLGLTMLGIVLLLVDTGGPLWFVISVLRGTKKKKPNQPPKPTSGLAPGRGSS